LGITGLVCKEKSLIYANRLEKELRFNSDIDNLIGIPEVLNFLAVEFSIDNNSFAPTVGVI
jgi:hypothetical protein